MFNSPAFQPLTSTKKPAYLLIVLLLGIAFSACSNRDLYEYARHNEQQKCRTKATQQKYEQCMQHQKQSFNEYERERQQTMESQITK